MPQGVDNAASLVEQLSQRLRDLERRVAALEDPSQTTSPAQPAVESSTAIEPSTATPDAGPVGINISTGVVPVLGKAILAMAGAYLLRAVAESAATTQFPMLVAAIVYAGLWMAWAVRSHRTNHFASATYGTTATLILAPLLWESTVRFQLLSVTSTSAVLVAFVVLVLVLAWHSNLEVLPWVATLASIATVWTLIVATHELVPLTCALLGIALATEVAACLGHRLSLWAMVAIAADSAVLLLIYVMTSPDGVPSSYQPASATTTALLSLSLLGIYGGGIAIRSFGERKRISNYEILQGMLAFMLAYFGAVRVSNGTAAPMLGVSFLVLSLVCYWGTLSRFADQAQTRNRRVSATWAVLLMLAGSVIVFPAAVEVPFLCFLGIASLLLYRKRGDLSLALHMSFYLAVAAAISALPSYGREALAGTVPGVPHWTVWAMLGSVLICYSIAPYPSEARWFYRLLWITPAALASFAVAALAVVALRSLIATRVGLHASHIAGIRTVVTCLVALGLGFLASRFKRAELGWLAYAAVAFGALKLFFEDLRFGNAASLVVSLLFYGLILILLPRLMKPGGPQSSAVEPSDSNR
jgi:hypothetical protein